jgi:hypothetical protein
MPHRQCRFLFLPAGGLPARIVNQHPDQDVLSDLLGGALPVPVDLGKPSLAMWVRETSGTEGLDRNVAASILAMGLDADPLVLLGPVALTSLVWLHSADGAVEGIAEGLVPPSASDMLAMVHRDIQRALAGQDSGFEATLRDDWAPRIRAAEAALRELPIPDSYPYGDRLVRDDPVWGRLAESLGGGRAYRPLMLG